MVSFWPFGKGGDKSAESFERVLSELSTKISTTSAQQDKYRLRQRKYKVLWSIYAAFSYILIVAILTLVIGWHSWSWIEYVVVGGGFPFIYTIRQSLAAYYDYLITNRQDHLNHLYKQREEAIDRLKKATKYNSTQQLLEKYGGSPPSKKRRPSQNFEAKKGSSTGAQEKLDRLQPARTGFAPPPTANIPSRQSASGPPPPRGAPNSVPRPQDRSPLLSQEPISPNRPNEEFAPNAFSTPDVPSQTRGTPTNFPSTERKWYDRILDVMLGEDEGSTKNRIALICQNCRLVNGQAPPGARSLEDIGKWRCSACHAMNGVESEESKILKHISREDDQTPTSPASPDASHLPGQRKEHADQHEDDDSAGSESGSAG